MAHLMVELILWILLAFFFGCIVGNLLRRLFTSGEAEALADRPPAPRTEAASAPATEPKPLPTDEAAPPVVQEGAATAVAGKEPAAASPVRS